jgi:protein-S-isoprenylcysteine O-methyltransferase Ste14
MTRATLSATQSPLVATESESHRQRKFLAIVGRFAGLAFGIGTQLLFLYTVVYLFLFLRYGGSNQQAGWLAVDLLLSIGFAIPHSLILAPPVQQFLKRWIPAGLLGCVHCAVTCLTLLVMFRFWRASPDVVWLFDGWSEAVILGLFYSSWAVLLYSIWLTGMGYQTGLTQWWYWAISKKPAVRPFVTNGIYRWMRHPVYLSFLGLIWFTPSMTADHFVLTLIWTAYIYLGSWFKDRRLYRYIGDAYREYGRRVPGLPFIGIGSLRRFQ